MFKPRLAFLASRKGQVETYYFSELRLTYTILPVGRYWEVHRGLMRWGGTSRKAAVAKMFEEVALFA